MDCVFSIRVHRHDFSCLIRIVMEGNKDENGDEKIFIKSFACLKIAVYSVTMKFFNSNLNE